MGFRAMEKFKIEIKWAFIFIGMMLSWMVLERLFGLHDTHIDKHATYTNFVAIPAILVYVFALLDKRKSDLHGFMSYKQALISGCIITAIVTVFTPLTQYLTTAVITPDYFNNVIDYSVTTGQMTQEEAEAFFNTKSYIIQSTIFTPVMGIVTTLIVGLFVKKNPN
jgi:hypothetical protein